MFAIVEMGGKQFKVEEDQIIQVEKIPGDRGDTISIDRILMLSDDDDIYVGKDVPATAHVTAEVLEQKRDQKIYVFKMKRRKSTRCKTGHRQYLTRIKIKEIEK